jgi:prepilin-type N-terminal cleavage/methylation domain-containing protein
MKRSGFTMIELVFVIVILGILASVAIPKLAATRDDANIAKASTEVSSMISDMGSYYTAHGHFAKVSDMTNVKLSTDGTKDKFPDGQDTDLKTSGNKVYYIDTQREKKCIEISANDANGTLLVKKDDDSENSLFCKGLLVAVERLVDVNHTFGGSTLFAE